MHLPVGGSDGAVGVFLACDDCLKLELFEMLTCHGADPQMLTRHK